MITATCKNSTCDRQDIAINMVGDPEMVVCGRCHQPTTLTDPRPDPPQPDTDA